MLHDELRAAFPVFAAELAERAAEPHFLEHVLPAATASELDQLESALGVPLPDSYKQLMSVTRGFWLCGGTIQLGVQHPFFHDFPPLDTLTFQQRIAVRQKGGQWPPPSQGMLCFAEFFVQADGDQVLWDVRQGLRSGEYPVYYYAHESRPPEVRRIAATFGGWLATCLEPFSPRDDE